MERREGLEARGERVKREEAEERVLEAKGGRDAVVEAVEPRDEEVELVRQAPGGRGGEDVVGGDELEVDELQEPFKRAVVVVGEEQQQCGEEDRLDLRGRHGGEQDGDALLERVEQRNQLCESPA